MNSIEKLFSLSVLSIALTTQVASAQIAQPNGYGDGISGLVGILNCDERQYELCLDDAFTEYSHCTLGYPYPPAHCLDRLLYVTGFCFRKHWGPHCSFSQ